MNKSESITELAKALNAFQSELQLAKKKETNPFFKSKYADLAEIWETCRPLLAKCGLSLSQMASVVGEHAVLTTMLMHNSGEWLSGDLILSPAKSNDPQALGSAITYGRRYAMSAMLGVATEDDDGETAMGRQFVTKPQPKENTPLRSIEPTPAAPQEATRVSTLEYIESDAEAFEKLPSAVKAEETVDLKTVESFGKEVNKQCKRLGWKKAEFDDYLTKHKGEYTTIDIKAMNLAERVYLISQLAKVGGIK